ncbi:hypothetical protein BZA05DRAFT_463616, partial [Tricharina praecox]|uniref:uncharacterized protein n=1 Tax=Tricharina praecox TaxID=43433 RepID=UPI0022202B8C
PPHSPPPPDDNDSLLHERKPIRSQNPIPIHPTTSRPSNRTHHPNPNPPLPTNHKRVCTQHPPPSTRHHHPSLLPPPHQLPRQLPPAPRPLPFQLPPSPTMPAHPPPTRRPALIPHNSDLSLSLSAASAALSIATYSPARDTPEDLLILTPATTPELGGEEFRRDVFSWVNSDDEEGGVMGEGQGEGEGEGGKMGTEGKGGKMGDRRAALQAITAPTSPREASFEAVEKQRRRLAAQAC